MDREMNTTCPASGRSSVVLILAIGLLVLIVIGLLFPAIQDGPLPHDKTKAHFDIKGLEQACRFYYLEYGWLPLDSNAVNLVTNNADLIFTLLATNVGANATTDMNPRKIVFLELPGRKGAFDPVRGGFLDPWGNPYHVFFDWSYSNRVIVGRSVVTNSVAVWSSGPNGKDESGAGDDLTSWR